MEAMKLRTALGMSNDEVFQSVVPQKCDQMGEITGTPHEYLTVLEGIVFTPLRTEPLVEFYCPEAGDRNEAFDEWLREQKTSCNVSVSFSHLDEYDNEYMSLHSYLGFLDDKFIYIWDIGVGSMAASAIMTLFATQEHVDKLVARFGTLRRK